MHSVQDMSRIPTKVWINAQIIHHLLHIRPIDSMACSQYSAMISLMDLNLSGISSMVNDRLAG
jgi:hypothetical protein